MQLRMNESAAFNGVKRLASAVPSFGGAVDAIVAKNKAAFPRFIAEINATAAGACPCSALLLSAENERQA